MKVTIEPKLLKRAIKKMDRLTPPVDLTWGEATAKAIITLMKDMIGKGISPIEGKGKFPAYKVFQKKGRRSRDRYPYSVMGEYPNKKISPVNLKLSGHMLYNLTYRIITKGKSLLIEIGYLDDEEAQKKEMGHRLGVNKQPKRPTIPLKRKGENFAAKIQVYILREFRTRIRNTLKGN